MATKKKAARPAAPVSILKEARTREHEADRAIARLKSSVDGGVSKASRRLDAARRRKRVLGRKKTTLGKRIRSLQALLKQRNNATNRKALAAAEAERKEVIMLQQAADKEIALMREELPALKLMQAENAAVGKGSQKARRDWRRRAAKKARRKRR
jgi:hypothetical protein